MSSGRDLLKFDLQIIIENGTEFILALQETFKTQRVTACKLSITNSTEITDIIAFTNQCER